MAEPFDAFAGALRVRDSLASCTCCSDDAESQERFETAEQLLAWVVETRAEMAAMRALETGSASREPLTPAQRAARYRARKAVTKTVTERHENRHAAVTKSVTVSAAAPSLSDSPSDLSISPESEASESGEETQKEEIESARERHGDRHETRDAKRDASFDAKIWQQWSQANRVESMGGINHDAIAVLRPALPSDPMAALSAFRAAADAYLADCKQRGKRGHFAFLAKDIGTWLQPVAPASGAAAPSVVSPARRLLNPPTKAGAA